MIRHIYNVECCPISQITSLPIPLPDGQRVWWEEDAPFQPVPIVGLAALSVQSRVESGVRLITSKIEAKLRCDIVPFDEPCLVRLTDVTGARWLIGTVIAPYPALLLNATASSTPSGDSGQTLLVEWTHIYPPLQLL